MPRGLPLADWKEGIGIAVNDREAAQSLATLPEVEHYPGVHRPLAISDYLFHSPASRKQRAEALHAMGF